MTKEEKADYAAVAHAFGCLTREEMQKAKAARRRAAVREAIQAQADREGVPVEVIRRWLRA